MRKIGIRNSPFCEQQGKIVGSAHWNKRLCHGENMCGALIRDPDRSLRQRPFLG